MARDEQKENILNSAEKLFARYGYRKTTLEDVAREAGMTPGNIYFYVKNKKDLYEQTVRHGLTEWRDSIARGIADIGDVKEKFTIMSRSAFEYLASRPDLREIIIQDPGIFTLSEQEDRFRDINDGAIEMIRAILRQGVREGRFIPLDVDHTAELLFSIYVMFLIKAYVKTEKSSSDTMFQEGLAIITRGISAA